MHPEAMAVMTEVVRRYSPAGPVRCLDVGSCNVNGTYRPLVEGRGWHYTGLDIAPGPNVDVVARDLYRYPFEPASFDAVISGSTMEHVPAIWRWVPELVRVLRPGGMLAIITHCAWEYHPFPVDCWRIMPDGMRYLFDLTEQLERYEIRVNNRGKDILGLAWKRQVGA